MLKIWTAFTISLLSSLSFASTRWNIIEQNKEVAETPAEVLSLQQKYPDVFGSYDATKITWANVTRTVWEYQGQTVCPINDPRLKFTDISYGLCLDQGDGARDCLQSTGQLPGLGDPCRPY